MEPPTSVIKLWLENHIFTFSTSSLKQPAGGAWVCLIQVCSNGGATYIIGEIIAKNNLNIVNLMQNLSKSFSPKLLNRILRYCIQIVLFGHVSLKFVQMVVPPTLSSK